MVAESIRTLISSVQPFHQQINTSTNEECIRWTNKSTRRNIDAGVSEATCRMTDKFVLSQDRYLSDFALQNIWCFAGIGLLGPLSAD